MKTYMTQAGRTLLANVLGNSGTLHFTKAQIGNGLWPTGDVDALRAEIANATELHQPLIEVSFASNESTDAATGEVTADESGFVKLTVEFKNINITNGFHLTEVGFFAENSVDSEDEEILYALCAVDETETAFVQPNTESVATFVYSWYIYVGDEADVTAVLSANAQLVPLETFNKHVNDHNNPHEVTKAQVGLGNVPNVTTNDQTPTVDESAPLENIESGETISRMLGKIWRAITSLFTHTQNVGDPLLSKNKGNPHGTTAASIGAAGKQHTHSTTDINDGVLEIRRGGTGLSTGAAFTGSSYNCWGYTYLPGGLLMQWGRVKVEDRDVTVTFDKAFASDQYVLTFDTSGEDFVPVWKKPVKTATSFKMNRTFGVRSSFNDWLQGLFGIRLFGGSAQIADWIAIGKAAE